MKSNNHMSARLLGDADDTTTVTITSPEGTTMQVPASMVGDIFSGDSSSEDDYATGDDSSDETVMGDVASLLGDAHVTHMGDIFSGDRRGGLKLGGMLPSSAIKKLSPAAKAAVAVIKTIPGAVIATKTVSPLIISHGLINNAPTRNMVPGASFTETIRRYETQYPGTTRTRSTTTTAAANVTFTFAAPTTAEGGNTLYCPVILIAIATQRQFQVANVEIGLSLTAVNESGAPVDNRQWTVLLSDMDKSCFFAFIPFTEISSTVYPAIAQASATNNLVLNVYNVPANTNVRVFLPGPDSSQYQLFKEGMGISAPTTKAMNLIAQR